MAGLLSTEERNITGFLIN
jgi:hypothetical protein